MADWIKIEKITPDKPEILALAAKLGMSQAEAFLLCFRLWAWADTHSTDGTLEGVTLETLDSAVFHRRGAAETLLKVGWLRHAGQQDGQQDGRAATASAPATAPATASLVIPSFVRHLGQSAKKRASDSARQSRGREKRAPPVTKMSRSARDKIGTPSPSYSSSSSSSEGGGGGETVPRSAPDEKPSDWLARKWLFYLTRAPNRNEQIADVATYFDELIRQGVPHERLGDEIDNRGRNRNETLWDMERRLLPKTNGTSTARIGLRAESIAAGQRKTIRIHSAGSG